MAKEKKQEKGFDIKIAGLAAVVVLLVVAGAMYFSQGSGASEKQAPVQTPQQPSTASAKLLLGSFDAQAAMQNYRLDFTSIDNGAKSHFTIIKNGDNSYVRIGEDFGGNEGFFGSDNRTDVVCLSYGAKTLCSLTGNDSQVQGIANNLRVWRLNPKASLEQKKQIEQHIEAQAIKFYGEPVGEKFGAFDTEKITYTLDYKNLTVQTLKEIGVPPNDPSLYSIEDWKVVQWIDKQTGLVVKSLTTYKENLMVYSFGMEYAVATPQAGNITAKPEQLVPAETFIRFYQDSKTDYSEKASCLSQPSKGEIHSCLKGLAYSTKNPEICKLITTKEEAERCYMIVAQVNEDAQLCENLTVYSDDCYIAVAGVTGNLDLCNKVKDPKLAPNCSQAAAEGKKQKEGTAS